MGLFQKKYIILLIAAALTAKTAPVFSQNEDRQQGLLTLSPYWRQALGGTVLSLPSVQAQSAVVALDGGNIRAYSASGTLMWNYSARGRISPYVTRSREGTSYFSRTNGILIAVNRSGRELWRRNLNAPLCGKIITGWDGRLFVPVDKTIYCFTASGTLLWEKKFEHSFAIMPKLDRSGGIIFALENNEVYRIDPFGNSNTWILTSKPAELLSIEQQRIITLYTDGTIEILGSQEEWFLAASQIDVNFSLLPKLPANPVAAASMGNNITAVLNDGSIAFVSIDERKILWNGDSHIREYIKNGGNPDLEAELIIDQRGIYVLSRNGACGFSYDGNRLWFIFLENAAAIPAFGDDGILYSGGTDWILYAYKIEDRILSTGSSIYGIVPDGSYNTGSPQSIYMTEYQLFEYEIISRLGQIEAAINAGEVGVNEPAWTTFLLNLSASREHVQLRLTSLRLLGRIGSRETIPWLVNIFQKDNEPLIKAAAASAIGSIGVDPDGIAIQTFFYSLTQTTGMRDEQVLFAIISATGALCRFSGPPLSESGIRILNLLTENTQPQAIRREANRELATLK